MLVHWTHPKLHLIELNCDGASRGNLGASGGCGVYRKSNGDILLAYYAYYGILSSLAAEAYAVLSGLHLLPSYTPSISLVRIGLIGVSSDFA